MISIIQKHFSRIKGGDRIKYSARMLFRDFREAHPDLWRRGSNFRLVDFMKILIYAPGLGKFTYEYFGDKITWIERWEDEREVKKKERAARPKKYTQFIFQLEQYMTETGYTQSDISRITGVSRKSINAYMSGKSIPKTSTMEKICNILNLKL